jgi:hypothetical protein
MSLDYFITLGVTSAIFCTSAFYLSRFFFKGETATFLFYNDRPDMDDFLGTTFFLDRMERKEIELNSALRAAREHLPDRLFPQYPVLSNFADTSIAARTANIQRSRFIRSEHEAILERHSDFFFQMRGSARNDLDFYIHYIHYINQQILQNEQDIDVQMTLLAHFSSCDLPTVSAIEFLDCFYRDRRLNVADVGDIVNVDNVDNVDNVSSMVDVASVAADLEVGGVAALDAFATYGPLTATACVVFAIIFEVLLHGKM